MVKQGIPNTSELDDDQIEALIRKLSAIKGSAPELLAALHDEANSRMAASRSGGSRTQQRSGGGGGRSGRETGAIRPVYEDDYDDEDDFGDETESEEEDEFDEDGPCVGYGYSDEVSVVSEMTTPTVVSNLNVPEEERYHEIQQGYGGASRSKKPDLLSQVNRVNAARTKQQQPSQSQAMSKRNSNSDLDPMKRKAYTSGLSAMAKISEGEPAAVSKPERKPAASTASRKAPQPPRRQHSRDGSPTPPQRKHSGENLKNRTGRGLKKKPSGENSKEEAVVGSKSPKVRTKKGSSSHNKSKSNSSHGSGSGSRGSGERRKGESDNNNSNNNNTKGFANDWHKSLSGADFDEHDMDDNGFPFSFGDEANNAFGASKSSGWGGDRAPTSDAFDPFGDAGFESFQGNNTKAPQKKTSSGSRQNRSSGAPSRSKREASPKRKPAPR